MLGAIVAFVLIGLLAPRFERQQPLLILGITLLMTALYFFSGRFM